MIALLISCFIAVILPFLAFGCLKLGGNFALTGVFILLAIEWCLPFLIPVTGIWYAYTQVSFCTATGIKMLDLWYCRKQWQQSTWKQWYKMLIHPFKIGLNSGKNAVFGSPKESLRLMIRGGIPMLLGAFVYGASLHYHIAAKGFWWQHTCNIIALFLFVIDGMFVFLMGFYRLLGGNSILLSDNPFNSATPAEFWRKYNRMASDYLNQYYFQKFKKILPVKWALMVPFVVSALIHEYMLWALTGKITGLISLYFLVQAIAVFLTVKIKLMPRQRIWGLLATFLFHYFAFILSFLAYNTFFKVPYPLGFQP